MSYKYTQNYPTERKDYPSKKVPTPLPSPSREPSYHPTEGNPDEGGKLSPADAERISSEDFPSPEPEEPDYIEFEKDLHKKAA